MVAFNLMRHKLLWACVSLGFGEDRPSENPCNPSVSDYPTL